jgi:O-antigen/teichoic acid export membrane protein
MSRDAEAQSLSAQTGVIMGIKIMAAGTAFAVQIPLARVMGAAEYGIYALLMSWVLIAAVFMRAGMDAAMVRYVAVYAAQGQYALMRGILIKGLGLAALLNVLACAVVFSVPALRDSAMAKAGVFLLIPAAMGVMLQGALRGLRRVLLPEVTEGLARPLLMLALFFTVTGAAMGMGAMAAAAANVVAGLATVAVLLAWLAWMMPRAVWRERADFSPWRDWRALALPMMAMAGLQVVLYRTDIVMVGMMTEAQQAGIYAVAARMAELAGFGVLAVNGIVAPLFAELHAAGDTDRLRRILRLSTGLALGLAVIVAAGFAVLGPWVIGLFGAEFVAAYTPLLILCAGQVAHAAASPALILMTMSGQQKAALIIFGICVAVNLALNYILIGVFGMTGAAVATAGTLALYAVMVLGYVRRAMT